MKRILLIATVIIGEVFAASAQTNGEESKLTGTIIGTLKSVDYGSNKESTTVNTRDCAKPQPG